MGWRSRGAAALAILAMAGGTAQAKLSAFDGGPFDGLQAEATKDGVPMYFVLELARQSPPSADHLAAVHIAIDAAKALYAMTPHQAYDDKPGLRGANESEERFTGRLLTQCRVGEPYELFRGRRVRIGIACGDRVTHFYVFDFNGDHPVRASIEPAIVPGVAPPGG